MSRAGEIAKSNDLINIKQTIGAYYELEPELNRAEQRVSFGTSGHRGEAIKKNFNQAHIAAITAAILEYREKEGISGPIFVGFDTHLLSIPAFETCLEVLAAAKVNFVIDSHITIDLIEQAKQGKAPKSCAIWTPTPAVSHAILNFNKERENDLADGIIITPSHNPPSGGGFKYNPPHGGAAESDSTDWIADRANQLLEDGWEKISRKGFAEAIKLAEKYDYREKYVADLTNVIDFAAIRDSKVKICADSLGGASIDYWSEIARIYDLDLTVLREEVDPTFRFITLDWDEKIRMDCSSPSAMAGVLKFANESKKYDIIVGNDTDADRHGIVSRNSTDEYSLMNPNHYLAVAIDYLFGGTRPDWSAQVGVGKTLVSSSLIDRITENLGKKLFEVPVGFKWFTAGLIDGSLGFAGEESAGATFLRKNGAVWTTDKDGIILSLLAAEIMAKTGKSPSEYHADLVEKYGESWYARIDAPATSEEKTKLKNLTPEQVSATDLAGEKIIAKLTEAPGNHAKIGGLKVVAKQAWFAARPSGTEDVYKIYAESFVSPEHLKEVQAAAKALVDEVIS